MDNESDLIQGNVTILVSIQNLSVSTLIFELYRTLEVDQILVNEEEVPFTHDEDELIISLSQPLDRGVLAKVQIFYGGQTGEGMVLETDENWGVPVTYTHSEPFSAKDWFPCKEELEDKADSVHIFVTTDYELRAVSNGILTGTTYYPNGKVRYEWKSNYPIAYYLISIAVTDYIEYNIQVQPEGHSKPIFIQNFLYDHPDCLPTYQTQIDATTAIMEVFCEHFGPYPFREEKYGHYLWPWGGGMEHQTMTGMGNFEFYLVSHELGHSWFGDYVTCATWQDIWINEGFATFAGTLATEKLGPEYADGERAYWFERAMREPDGTVYIPAIEADNPSRIFSGNLSYGKGMALVHMIRFEMQDDDLFYQILRSFISRYANDVATGLDFKEVLEEASGMDFTDFFNQWYFGAGYPIFELNWEQQGQELTLHSTQTTSSEMTSLFKTSMEYRIFYPGGDTTVKVFHGDNLETYQFNIQYSVDSIQVDPNDHILNMVKGIKKSAIKKSSNELFNLYPNPNHGLVSFRMLKEEVEDVTVEVYNGPGQLVFSGKYEGCVPFASYAVDMMELTSGLYFIRLGYRDQYEIKKIVVE